MGRQDLRSGKVKEEEDTPHVCQDQREYQITSGPVKQQVIDIFKTYVQ
jgi:hypothetical protein